MNYFAVFYRYDPASEEIIATRPVHREFLSRLLDEGILVGSGPFEDAEGGALIVIRLAGTDATDAAPIPATVADAERLMDEDPFWQAQLLAGRQIRPWNPVLNVFN